MTDFDPSKYLTKVGSADYLEVKWRLVWLREQHPDADIDTQLMSPPDTGEAIFKARITIPGGGSATGWGSETPNDFRDYLEKAETKAIGRALSALGYGTQFAPDHDFGSSAGKVVDAPVSRNKSPRTLQTTSKSTAKPANAAPTPITANQSAEYRDAEQVNDARTAVNVQHLRSPMEQTGMPEPPSRPDGVLIRKLHQEGKLRGLGDGDVLHANVHRIAVSQGYSGIGVMTDADIQALTKFIMTCRPGAWAEVKHFAGVEEPVATAK